MNFLVLIIILFFKNDSYSNDEEVWKVYPQEKLIYLKNGKIKEIKNPINFPRNNFETTNDIEEKEIPHFEPTIVENEDEVQKIFNELRVNYKRNSECSDRAHIWSKDLFDKYSINTQKIFIFFTASYINRVRFKWWFHVAPLVLVNTQEGIEERVLDFRYTDRPLKIKEWTDLMVFSERDCKPTNKFSEYDINPQTEDCYIMKESMYYRLPYQLHEKEIKNKFRNQFYSSEIKFALRNAFYRE